MQSIQTKFIGPTNYRSSRVKAWCGRGAITVAWQDGIGVEENHIAAAETLCAKFVAEDVAKYGEHKNNWGGPRVCGGLPGEGYCHTFLPMDHDGKRQELCPVGTMDALASLVKLHGAQVFICGQDDEKMVERMISNAQTIIQKAGAK